MNSLIRAKMSTDIRFPDLLDLRANERYLERMSNSISDPVPVVRFSDAREIIK